MGTIFQVKNIGLVVLLGALTTAWGCESVGLLGRDSVDARYGDRRDVDRRGDYDRRDRDDRDIRRNQVTGVIQDVDERRRELRVRTDEGRTTTIRYNDRTEIRDRDRDIRANSLRSGDSVSIRLDRGSDGEQYAETIRVEDRRGSGWWR